MRTRVCGIGRSLSDLREEARGVVGPLRAQVAPRPGRTPSSTSSGASARRSSSSRTARSELPARRQGLREQPSGLDVLGVRAGEAPQDLDGRGGLSQLEVREGQGLERERGSRPPTSTRAGRRPGPRAADPPPSRACPSAASPRGGRRGSGSRRPGARPPAGWSPPPPSPARRRGRRPARPRPHGGGPGERISEWHRAAPVHRRGSSRCASGTILSSPRSRFAADQRNSPVHVKL